MDKLYGGPGSDRIYGLESDDIIYGGDNAEDEADIIFGDGGDDIIHVRGNGSFASGGSGNDKLYGD